MNVLTVRCDITTVNTFIVTRVVRNVRQITDRHVRLIIRPRDFNVVCLTRNFDTVAVLIARVWVNRNSHGLLGVDEGQVLISTKSTSLCVGTLNSVTLDLRIGLSRHGVAG